MKIKVCGNKYNAAEVLGLRPDFMGFILYEKSPRYVSKLELNEIFKLNFGNTKKVAVAVNMEFGELKSILDSFSFDAVQLHGTEDAVYCAELKKNFPSLKLIKAFSVSSDNIPDLSSYEKIDYFLFDTASSGHGGSGRVFDWSLLAQINSQKKYFLAGGLNPDNIDLALAIKDENLYALDLNSGFEISPGLKSEESLSKVFNRIRI